MAPASDEEVYCICRKPDDGNKMVACDKCEEWFHADCVGFTEEMDAEEKPYFCKACSTRKKKPLVKRRATTPIKTPGKKFKRGLVKASPKQRVDKKAVVKAGPPQEQPERGPPKEEAVQKTTVKGRKAATLVPIEATPRAARARATKKKQVADRKTHVRKESLQGRNSEEGTPREGAGPGSSGELSAALSRLTDIDSTRFSRLAVLEFARMIEDDTFLPILESA